MTMDGFQTFRSQFKPTGQASPTATTSYRDRELIRMVPGLSDLIAELGGKVLNDGAYRLLDDQLAEAAEDFIAEAMPVQKGIRAPFGCDWMGRIYAVDGSKRRAPNGELCACLLDPATRDLLSVPGSVADFHNSILVEEPDVAYEEPLWHQWRERNKEPLAFSDVVGWKTPAFLGGSLEVSNLEVQPACVYWPLAGQLIAQAFNLKPGTPIRSVTIE